MFNSLMRPWRWLALRIHRYPWALFVIALIAWAWLETDKKQRGIVALSGALVLVTIYYAVQTRIMVSEMREATLAQARPKLVPTLLHSEASHDELRLGVSNVGAGAALDVDLRLMFEPPIREHPMKDSRSASWDRPLPVHWKWPVIESAATWVFNQPVGPPAEYMRIHEALRNFTHVRLVGRAKSPAGERLTFDERIDLGQVPHYEIAATPLREGKEKRRRP